MDRLDTDGLRIWFRFPDEYSTGEVDASPFLPGLLVTSMWWNEDLVIDGPVSARLLANVDEAMSMYRCLFPSVPAVEVFAPSCELLPGRARTACLFSRGVDSWYSVLKSLDVPDPRRPPLTHLVYVPSIDFMYGDENRARSIAVTREAAQSVGCELVEVTTNIRHFTERFQEFGVTFGGVLSGIGLALGAGVSHMLLASSLPISAPNHLGSDPALDPLWSTERTEIVHHGEEATRLEKTRFLSLHRAVLPYLKVCPVVDSPRNCGRCNKCLLTMCELHVAGLLDECPAFESQLDPRAVSRLPHPGWQRFALCEILDALGDAPLDTALRMPLDKVLLREELHSSAQRARRLAKTRLLSTAARWQRMGY